MRYQLVQHNKDNLVWEKIESCCYEDKEFASAFAKNLSKDYNTYGTIGVIDLSSGSFIAVFCEEKRVDGYIGIKPQLSPLTRQEVCDKIGQVEGLLAEIKQYLGK